MAYGCTDYMNIVNERMNRNKVFLETNMKTITVEAYTDELEEHEWWRAEFSPADHSLLRELHAQWETRRNSSFS